MGGTFRYKELKALMLGDLLGSGSSREVYEFKHDPLWVVKIELAGRSFQNVAEWEAWKWVRATPQEKWFAPCQAISPCGSMLLQRRTTMMRPGEVPKRIPAYLVDIKPENFGWLHDGDESRVVCIDYGNICSNVREWPTNMVVPIWKDSKR